MRLAAAEVGLELHNRIAAAPGQALDATAKQALQALGEKRAAKELDGIAVLFAALAEMHLPEVGGELRLLVAPAGHVGMRRDDLAPRTEDFGSRRRNERSAGLPLLGACLLIDNQPAQFAAHLRDGVCLRRRNRRKETRCRVERALRVITGEAMLVRPFVSPLPQLADQRAFGVSEALPEHLIP